MEKFIKQKKSFYFAASAFALVMLFTFFPLTLAPLKNTSADSVPSLLISSLGNINLRIRANSNGSLAIVKDTITATTTNDNGYQLYLSASPNIIYREGYTASNATASDKIQPISATFTSPRALSLSNSTYGTWGFAITGGNFSPSYSTDTPSLSSKFAQVPNAVTGSFNSQLIHSTTSQSINDETDIYYGVMANTQLNNGAYSTTLLYTALAEVSNGTPGSHATVEIPTGDLIYGEYGDDQTITITTDLITSDNIGEAKVNLINKETSEVVPCNNVHIISQSPVTVACNIPSNLNPGDHDIEITIPEAGKTYTVEDAFDIKISYTIYYNANEGTNAPADGVINYPSSSYSFPLASEIPTRSGYTFLGWSENPNDATATYKYNGSSFSPNTVALTKANPIRKIYAIWENNGNYIVSYNANGGTNAPARFSVPIDTPTYAATIDTTTTPTNGDLGFAGYAESATATNPTYIYNSVANTFSPSTITLNNTSKKSATLYAIWETINYSVSYNANGGSNIPSNESYNLKQASKEITINTSKIPTRTNYEFIGYAESADGPAIYSYNSNTRAFTPSTFTLTKTKPSKTLYAVFTEIFTHTLAYSASGATTPSSRTIRTTEALSSINIDTSIIPSKSNATFLGYANSATATTPNYTYDAGSNSFSPAKVSFGATSTTITLYAIFQNVYTYRIDYYADHGTNVPDSQVETTANTSTTISISPSVPSRSGYKFLGWDEDPNAITPTYVHDGISFTPATITLTTEKRTYSLYAIWTEYRDFKLIYDPNGASAGVVPAAKEESGTTLESTTYTIDTSVIPTRSGYTFLGYAESNTAPAATYVYSSGSYTPSTITLTKTNNIVTLYAIWAKTYSISYSANGGSGTPSGASFQTTDTNYSFTIATDVIPTRDSYQFLGYSTRASDTTADYSYNSATNSFSPNAITLNESSSTATLFAIWRKIYTYTLSYDVNGGSTDADKVPAPKTYTGIETAHEFPIWVVGDPIPVRPL